MEETNTLPGASERVGRRGVLKAAVGMTIGLVGLVLGLPLIDYLVGPAFGTKKREYVRVGQVQRLPLGEPKQLTFPQSTNDAYISEVALRNVWAIRTSASEVVVFSPVCTHLGCRFDWDPQSRRFQCPCHGSVFGPDGTVLSGPAPRPLDTLPTKIQNGELMVEWERFKPGIPQKVAV